MDNACIAAWPRNLANLSNRLAGRDIAISLSCGQAGPVFIVRPETAGVEFPATWGLGPESEEKHADVTLEADGEIWEIRAWGRAADALLALPDGLNVEDIPAELKPALLASALEPLLDQASRALGHVFRLAWPPGDRTQSADSGPENPVKERFLVPFTVTDSAGNPAGAGAARIPLSAAALSALADMARFFPRRSAADCSALPLSLSLCAARESFPIRILREAEPGDVLRFSCPAHQPLTLEVNGRTLWTASLADGKITLEGVLNNNPEEAAMSATPENAATPAAKDATPGLSQDDIGALEITLSLELDERRITIGELAVLAPGHILHTTASLDAPVTIKAGGKAVGRGRLVEVGGNLGVLIASLELDVQGRDKSAV
jgi:type III secretion system YscQ/HrcQ family protein